MCTFQRIKLNKKALKVNSQRVDPKTLLDKMGRAVIGDFQMDQCHLMLKWLQMKPYMVTKRRCVLDKTFSIVWNKVISCFIS